MSEFSSVLPKELESGTGDGAEAGAAATDASNADRDKFAAADVLQVDRDKFEIFEKWLLDNGSKFPQLELKDYGNEVRGVHAKDEIGDDVIIVEIPLRCLITVEMGKETDVGRKILSTNIELDAPKHIFLMLFMLIDRRDPSSFFKPYYDILPLTLSNMPIFWTEEELNWLQGSYLLQQIEERKTAIENDYRSICSIAPEFSQMATLEEFSWARMCVCSRNFGLTVNGVRTAALVPYADMLNHYRPRETKWEFDDSHQGFIITTLQKINAGAQVYDSYGQKCNHRFLLNYGFSIENNIESDGTCPNEVPLLLTLSESDPLYARKISLYGGDGSLPLRRVRVSISDNENTKILFALLRIIAADEEDLSFLTSNSGHSFYRSIRDAYYPVSLKNERAAMSLLQTIIEEHTSRYPATLDEDVQLLKSGELAPFSNQRHAVIQVKGEKEVLRHFLDHAQTAQLVMNVKLDTDPYPLYEAKHHLVAQYCSSVLVIVRRDELRRQEMMRKQIDFSKPTVV